MTVNFSNWPDGFSDLTGRSVFLDHDKDDGRLFIKTAKENRDYYREYKMEDKLDASYVANVVGKSSDAWNDRIEWYAYRSDEADKLAAKAREGDLEPADVQSLVDCPPVMSKDIAEEVKSHIDSTQEDDMTHVSTTFDEFKEEDSDFSPITEEDIEKMKDPSEAAASVKEILEKSKDAIEDGDAIGVARADDEDVLSAMDFIEKAAGLKGDTEEDDCWYVESRYPRYGVDDSSGVPNELSDMLDEVCEKIESLSPQMNHHGEVYTNDEYVLTDILVETEEAFADQDYKKYGRKNLNVDHIPNEEERIVIGDDELVVYEVEKFYFEDPMGLKRIKLYCGR